MSEETPKTVPARNNFKKEPVFVKATIADQAGSRPGYVRMWVNGKDPQHPNHVDKYTTERFVGDESIGYCKAEPWTVVQRGAAKQGRKRDDDSAGIDTAQTHGDLVLIETTEENAAVFSKYKDLRADQRAKALGAGDSETTRADNGGRASYRARVGKGMADADPRETAREVLNQ